MKKVKKFKKKEDNIPGLGFVGCLFLGMGFGMFYGNVSIGVLIGLGVGFIVMAFLKYFLRKKK